MLEVHSRRVDKKFELNKQLIAFFERVLLLDVGILALSITTLTALTTRFPTAHLPKGTFLWTIVPGWSLLLISTHCCWRVILDKIADNHSSFIGWSSSELHYDLGRMVVQLAKFSSAIGGTIPAGSEMRDVSQVSSEFTEKLKKNMEELSKKPPELKTSPWIGVVAIVAMELGLLLLCYSAVRLLIAL